MSASIPVEVVPHDGEPLTTPRALAATLGYDQRMVHYWAEEGCPYYDIEGLKRFRESEVRRWLRGKGRLAKSPAAEQRAARELNSAMGIRSPQSGHTGQPKRKDRREYTGARREYLRKYQREYVAKRRADWFAGKSCIDCGTTERLEIDHVVPELKIHHAVWSWAEERREAELAKCVVRCNACHMKRHGRTPGGAHGGKLRYESGCRCLECVEGQRERDRVKRRNKRLREAARERGEA